jgi:hypothetical protein
MAVSNLATEMECQFLITTPARTWTPGLTLVGGFPVVVRAFRQVLTSRPSLNMLFTSKLKAKQKIASLSSRLVFPVFISFPIAVPPLARRRAISMHSDRNSQKIVPEAPRWERK